VTRDLIIDGSNNVTQPIIPEELEQLSRLVHLRICACSITSLPSTIGCLQFLRTLNLRRNQLSRLPPESGYLYWLSNLDLSYNCFTELPSVLANLVNLEILDVTCNRLSYISAEVASLPKLSSLLLEDNPYNFDLIGRVEKEPIRSLKEVIANRIVDLPSRICATSPPRLLHLPHFLTCRFFFFFFFFCSCSLSVTPVIGILRI
jgi:Leucine-rich repeat (LRR) protein